MDFPLLTSKDNCCRFFQRLTGDVRAITSEDGSPAAEQLCLEAHASQAPLVALGWTQRGNGLLCADLAGGVTMYKLRLPPSVQPLNSTPSGGLPGTDVMPSSPDSLDVC